MTSPVERGSRRIGWIVTVVVLSVLTLAFGTRSLSLQTNIGATVEGDGCMSAGEYTGYCLRHVHREDQFFFAAIDDIQVFRKGSDRHLSLGNPWVDDSKMTVSIDDGGFTLTDGQVEVRLSLEVMKGLEG